MIEIKKVSMNYGPVVALSNISFNVNKGEILGLLGPNGAGKSTLMRVLTTFIYPCGGTATICGHDILEDPLKVRGVVGYLPEIVPLYSEMRVDEYLNFVGKARGLAGKKLRERTAWVKKTCAIAPVWKHTVHELSKGFRQRVGLAQALIHDPEVLILDEPTSGLDPLQIIEIRRLIKELAREKTIIFSTHILQEVEALADRIVIINDGVIISSGTRDQLAEKAMKYRCHVITVSDSRENVEKALGGLRGAKSIKYAGHEKGGFVTFEIQSAFGDDDICRDLNLLMKENSWTIKTLKEKAYNLENTFISLLSEQKSKKSGGQ